MIYHMYDIYIYIYIYIYESIYHLNKVMDTLDEMYLLYAFSLSKRFNVFHILYKNLSFFTLMIIHEVNMRCW